MSLSSVVNSLNPKFDPKRHLSDTLHYVQWVGDPGVKGEDVTSQTYSTRNFQKRHKLEGSIEVWVYVRKGRLWDSE